MTNLGVITVTSMGSDVTVVQGKISQLNHEYVQFMVRLISRNSENLGSDCGT